MEKLTKMAALLVSRKYPTALMTVERLFIPQVLVSWLTKEMPCNPKVKLMGIQGPIEFDWTMNGMA